jgi:hypothetical protein
LAWFFVDKARSVKFGTVRRLKAIVFNFYERMPGLHARDIPTSSSNFTHRFDGMAQRLGVETRQDLVFRGVLLVDMVALMEADWARARGGRKVELALVNAAFHLYFQAGLRANEAFHCTVGEVRSSLVRGQQAQRLRLRSHLHVLCATQTKEERYERTAVPVAWGTFGECPLSAGRWVVRALRALASVGMGADAQPDRVLFSDSTGKRWAMDWFWSKQVLPRLQRLQQQGLGGLGAEDDLAAYGSNSPRRTWNSMAAKHPNPVSEDLRETQGRWRRRQKKRQSVKLGMAQLYHAPDLDERLRATFFLALLK